MADSPLLHYRRDGREEAEAERPPLILGPSIGTCLRLWDEVVPALAADHTVIRYDLPGHGRTPASALPSLKPDTITIADLAQTVLNLANALGIKRFNYAGVSLGGAIGMWLAIHRPERIASLAVVLLVLWLARAMFRYGRTGAPPPAEEVHESVWSWADLAAGL